MSIDKSVFGILKEIKEAAGSNAKKDILSKYTGHSDLQRVILYTYNKNYVYYIKKLPEYDKNDCWENKLSDVFNILDSLSNRDISGNDASNAVKQIFDGLTSEDAYIFERILDRSLKIDLGTTHINKVFKEAKIPADKSTFIPTTPYMGAQSYSEKKVKALFENHGVVYCDVKADGRYANIKIFKDKVEIESRQGDVNYLGNAFKHLTALYSVFNKPCVLNCELIIPGVDRFISNGIISSIVSIGKKILAGKNVDKEKAKLVKEYGMDYEEITNKITAIYWDIIPYDAYVLGIYDVPRWKRLSDLETTKRMDISNINIVVYKKFKTMKDALIFYKETVAAGEEGIIAKGKNSIWKTGKHADQLKFKLEMTISLKIIGFREGKKGTKYEGSLGAFMCESLHGKLKANPSGIADALRPVVWADKEGHLGLVIEVKCNGISTNRQGGTSCLHPSFIRYRDDTDADTIEEIYEIEEMVLSL